MKETKRQKKKKKDSLKIKAGFNDVLKIAVKENPKPLKKAKK